MSLGIIARTNGTFQARIRLPQLKSPIGKSTYHETFDTKAEARRQGEQLHAQYLRGLVPTNCRHENVTLDILDKYLKERVPEMRSADSEGCRARKMQKCMGHLRLHDISIKFLEEYKATRSGP